MSRNQILFFNSLWQGTLSELPGDDKENINWWKYQLLIAISDTNTTNLRKRIHLSNVIFRTGLKNWREFVSKIIKSHAAYLLFVHDPPPSPTQKNTKLLATNYFIIIRFLSTKLFLKYSFCSISSINNLVSHSRPWVFSFPTRNASFCPRIK